MLRILVVGLVVLVAAMFLLPRGNRGGPLEGSTALPEPHTLARVELVDVHGSALRLDQPAGEFTWVFFGYTKSPDVGPLTLQALADARRELAQRAPLVKAPRVVFVSVDPQRDGADEIATYLARFDAEFIGATAATKTLEPLLAELGITVERRRRGTTPYTVTHSSAVYVLDAAGRWIAVAPGPHDPHVLAADYLKIRQRFRTAPPPAA
jgi:protein SCO1/2